MSDEMFDGEPVSEPEKELEEFSEDFSVELGPEVVSLLRGLGQRGEQAHTEQNIREALDRTVAQMGEAGEELKGVLFPAVGMPPSLVGTLKLVLQNRYESDGSCPCPDHDGEIILAMEVQDWANAYHTIFPSFEEHIASQEDLPSDKRIVLPYPRDTEESELERLTEQPSVHFWAKLINNLVDEYVPTCMRRMSTDPFRIESALTALQQVYGPYQVVGADVLYAIVANTRVVDLAQARRELNEQNNQIMHSIGEDAIRSHVEISRDVVTVAPNPLAPELVWAVKLPPHFRLNPNNYPVPTL